MSKLNIAGALKNLIDEYKKIYWPSREEVYHVTVMVLLVTVFVAIYILLFDNAFDFLLSRITEGLKNLLGGI